MADSNKTFKEQHPYQKRVEVAAKIRQKYPDRLPVIVEKAPGSKAPDIDKRKYLVPVDITIGNFYTEIRNHIKIDANMSIFLFVNNVIPPTPAPMFQIYDQYKDDDGFLYIQYTDENTFGCL
eukprot:CAMPEP_0119130708 /NCGR_PEP_ID=MMETSP1310-20130426/8506_1 /TAXON_ID=464262 /ORGANISM="Genus nov. species nov., Strain RCC2339" /LENGTH=121 /DNA_ID=CAMNT_0007121237 /DNA_START=113 /DNA_END=478 /DNA_ORIENTATION=-